MRMSSPDTMKRPIIAMHPGSGGDSTARRWAPERFAQLADTLYANVGGQLVLLGGPEEAELHQHIIDMMQSDLPVRSLAGRGNIKVAAAVLEQVDLFVGNDSSLMHLAVTGGAPTVAIFGLTNQKPGGHIPAAFLENMPSSSASTYPVCPVSIAVTISARQKVAPPVIAWPC